MWVLMKPGWQWHQLDHMQSFAPYYRRIATPAPHHSIFTGQMLFQTPNQSVKRLQQNNVQYKNIRHWSMRKPLEIRGTSFFRPDFLPNQQREWTERKSQHWPKLRTITHWTHLFFLRRWTPEAVLLPLHQLSHATISAVWQNDSNSSPTR